MKVIATTSHSVLLLDCLTGDGSVLHRGAGLYYGLARVGTGYAVAARRRLVSSAVSRSDERGHVLLFDSDFQPSGMLEAPFPLRDMHQIAWFDDRLWVTCSFDDMVAVYDGASWERWYPRELPCSGAEEDPEAEIEDCYHYNSFFIADAEMALLAHNHGRSELDFFDRRSRVKRRSFALGYQAHNIWMDGSAYVTCSSMEGKLIATSGWELITGGFPRGICLGATHRAVGISALAERGQRDGASAAVAVYDASWTLIHYVHLVREGMVLDLAPARGMGTASIEAAAAESLRCPILQQLNDVDLTGN